MKFIIYSSSKWIGGSWLLLPILITSALISGCAVKTFTVDLVTAMESGARLEAFEEKLRQDPAIGAFIKGVPFYPQERYMCGPSAIRSVLNYYGLNIGEREAVDGVYSENIKGALMMDLLIFTKSKELYAKFYEGSVADLKRRLKEGRPLLLLVDMGIQWLPRGHYIVAVGYDDERGKIIAHSGKDGHKFIGFKKLKKAWRKTGYSTLLISPDGIEE